MNKQRWYRWHSLAGLPLAVLLCFIMLTGTLAVMSHELDWLTNPAVRAQPSNTPLNWPQYYRAALSSSDGNRIYQLAAPIHNGFAADTLLYDENNQRYHAYIDPVTYAHTGNGTWFNWQTLLRRIHRHLMMPLNIGLPIVSLTAFPLLLSLVSGLILHPKWWKGLWRLPRKQNSRVFWGDFHRLSGLWSSWLLVVISITGIWYFAEKYGLGATYPKDGSVISEHAKHHPVRVSPEIFDKLITTVQRQRPELEIKSVFFPIKAGQPVRVEGQSSTMLVRNRADNMVFDPESGNLLSQRIASDLSFHVRISEAADPLHFGVWGGYWSKTLYFFFGLLLTSLSITGTIIYAHRVTKWRRNETPGLLSVIGIGFQGTKKTGLLSAVLLLICLALTLETLLA